VAAAVKPVKAPRAAYDAAYERYTRIYPALQEISKP
jgi:sugar (pentulose or hexulose) kinase